MRILIAGLGAIGQRHARNLRALLPDAELLAYRRRRDPRVITEQLTRDGSRNVETELGIRSYGDLDEALAARPDAVFICTPSSQHLEIAQRAAAADCHLFIEKPVSHSLDGMERLAQLVEAKGLIAMVGCQWRFHPCLRALRDLLRARWLGPLVNVEINYAEYLPDWHPYEDYRSSYAARRDLGGGVVLTQIHDYDMAVWLFGAPRSVRATGGHFSDLEIDVEDTVDATLMTDVVSIRLRQTFAERPSRRSIIVTGALGTATLDLLGANLTVTPPIMPEFSAAGYERNDMFRAEADHFIDCVQRNVPTVIPLEQGIVVLRVALAVKESMHACRSVVLQ